MFASRNKSHRVRALAGLLLACATILLPMALGGQTPSSLLLPVATAYDSAGNLFFADARRHQIFELTLAGTWSVVAGTGEQGFGGDGGVATSALLNTPHGVAVGADGTLYIADTGNQRVRAVAHGVISTIAGSGVRGFSGDGPALGTALRDPSALATDANGGLLLCDTGNHRVRKLTSGNLVTIAGTGVQGFSGDGGAAVNAELDTPSGVAVNNDGSVLIADTHNHRVRRIDSTGTITTLAGNNTKGFAGDGGNAALASLDQPIGVAFAQNGTVLIADSSNQRIRSVAASGVITTIAGTGVQGFSADATTALSAVLNNPQSVSLQPLGPVAFAESHSALVRELAADNALYTLALLASPRTSVVSVSAAPTATYGRGTVSVLVSGSASIPQGTVTLQDSGTAISSAQLVSGSSTFSLSQLGTGSHSLTANYAGDGLHGSSSSGPASLLITPAVAIADANAATRAYGAPLPSLSGSLSGVLPQDAASVHATFSTAASLLAPPGVYPITASLTGQGNANYTLQMDAGSGSLTVTPAASLSTLAPVAQTYEGLPLLLSANVASTTSGSPTGSVDFLDGSSVVASSALSSGGASASVLAVSAGGHSYSARYHGDTNFLASTSAVTSVTVSAMPDFGLAFASPSQSVQGGAVAVFTFSVSPQNGPFTGAVAFSVSGLPQGATATFSPVSVIPGASPASVNLSVQTVARSGALQQPKQIGSLAGLGLITALSCIPILWRRRRGVRLLLLVAAVSCMPLGCGTRSTGTADTDNGQIVTLTVRGTGTNLAGAAVSHTATATLMIL